MDPFNRFAERIKNRPLTIVLDDGQSSISVLVFYASESPSIIGSLRQVWRNIGVAGARISSPIAHQIREYEVLRELLMTVPISIDEHIEREVIVITADSDMKWALDADPMRIAKYLHYVSMTIGMLFSNPGTNGAARIWSAPVIEKLWSAIHQ